MDGFFEDFFRYSTGYLDNTHEVLSLIVNGQFTYPIWDFMYFSIVTITTLGYGDILPNPTDIRILVMFESIIGVVIAGCFVSALFLSERK